MHSRMRFTSKLLLPFISALALLIAACGGGGAGTTAPQAAHTKAPANKQVLVTVVASGAVPDFDTLDPAVVTDFDSAYAIGTIFTGLVGLDDHMQIVGQEAQSWDRSSDGLSYTFHLRPNMKFSDGTPLTAQDIAWSIDRALSPEMKSPVAPYYLRYIKDSDKRNSGAVKSLIGDSLIVTDPNTLQITLNKPIAFFLDTLTYPCSDTVEKSLIDKYGTKWTDHLTEGGGNGPFKVKKYTHNITFNVVPNPNFYGPKPQLQEVDMPFYKVQDTTYKDYQVNRLDDATVPIADFDSVKTHKDFFQFPILAINYYTMNYKQKPFDNIHIRQAFDLAINKDLIVKNIWKGTYIATNHIVPQGQYGYNPDLTAPDGNKSTAGDPAKAKQLLQQGLQEEGYSSVSQLPQITLTYSSAGNQAVKNEAAAEQQMWQTVLGVNVKLNDIDLNRIFNYESEGANNPLMFYSGPAWLADYPDPEDWTTLQFDKGAAQNGMNFGQNNGSTAAQQQALQQQMEQADLMTDPNARLKAYNQIEQQLVNFVAWMPVSQQTAFGVRKPCVQNFFQNSLLGTSPEDWSKIYISTDTPCANATVSS